MTPDRCPDCNRPVSSFERACPHCGGHVPKRPMSFAAVCCLAFLFFVIVNVLIHRAWV